MVDTAKLSELVETVRKLNWEVRPKIATIEGANTPGNPLHASLAALRNHEIHTSQLVRGMSLVDTSVDTSGGAVVETIDAQHISSRQLLSEFATAREAILSILRNLNDNQWGESQATADGDLSYEDVVDRLIESDKVNLNLILNAAG